ncbi:MAG TPA: SRPBCC family protein [Humisphaera sp.]
MTQTYIGSTPRYEPADQMEPSADAAGDQAGPKVNVGTTERAISAGAGLALAWLGMKVRGLTGLAMVGGGVGLTYRAYTGHCGLYEKLGVDTARTEAPEPQDYYERGIHVEVAYTIAKPRAELYAYWRNFENLPTFMDHLKSVRVVDEKKSHWVAKAPAGRKVEWYAEIINEQQDELIAWRSLANADVDNAGSVRFVDAPGDRGTEVRVVLDYIPPAGKLGKYIAMLFGEAPEIQIKEDLRRFKRLMETGLVPTIEGQPMGTCTGCNE